MHSWPEITGTIDVVGATGAVGLELLGMLEARGVCSSQVRAIASTRSKGRRLPYGEDALEVRALDEHEFDSTAVAFFSASSAVSRTHAARAVEAGATVIDNSSAFRMDPSILLIVPEVNGTLLDEFKAPGIIANPNCSTIIALMAVAPIHNAVGITRMQVATYQAVSGAGTQAIRELEQQTADYANNRPLTTDALPSPALFNVFCHESPIDDSGFNEEERKLRNESRKILGAPNLAVAATCVRVGVPRAHAMAIDLTLDTGLTANDARELLAQSPGIDIVDDRTRSRFPEPRHAAGGDLVLVGRLRNDPDRPSNTGLLLFACGDQIRKGAALNAIQILERLP